MWVSPLLVVVLVTSCGGDLRPRGRVCDSIDARNSPENLISALQDCRVVEGYVHIQLIDLTNDTELERLTFPALREISHHLLLYRVSGLRSLAQLFPNLAVIRGASLYFDEYALVVYEMFGLQDVAFPSLAVIARGGVLAEKSPSLCYVHTVDWMRIVKDRNMSENGMRLREGEVMPCPRTCPAHCGGGERARCWNEHHCQQSECPERCGDAPCFTPHSNTVPAIESSSSAVANTLECCHSECLGGCWGPAASQCYLCRNAIHNQSCVASCPPSLVLLHNSRCITQELCQSVEPSTEHEVKPWRVFNGTCIPSCPPNFEEFQDNYTLTCQPCGKGGCKKICISNKVDSLLKAQNLEGCTYINSSLEIQINGGKDVSVELLDYLGAIEEIEGSLKITRSFSLLNLHFFKSLRAIHGKSLDKGKYIMVVLDNPNLQELWNWTSTEHLHLGNGSLFFHLNPKLCPREIQKLQWAANLPASSLVSNVTNGDEVECVVVDLKARVTTKLVSSVILEWEVLSVPKQHALLGYLVYSIEAPEQNVTAYDGLDVCGGNDWRVDDVSNAATYEEDSSGDVYAPRGVYQILTRLKPNTQYAFYVKTYSLTTASHYGGQSPIQYFTTLPSRPSPPVNLRASSHHNSELSVQWSPPAHPNGNLSYFLVVGQWIPDDQEFLLEQRDYCQHPMTAEDGSNSPHVATTKLGPHQQPCCRHHRPTPVSQPSIQQRAQTQSEECRIKCGLLAHQNENSDDRKEDCFTSFLHDLPYKQELNYTVKLDTFPQDEAIDPKKKNESRDPSVNQNVTIGGVLYEFSYTVPPHLNSVLAKPLRHYGLYTIQVWACRQPHPEEPPGAEKCSSANQISVRTAPHQASDLVTSVNATVNATGVRLFWNPPVKPNGLILAYNIEWRKEGQGSFRPLMKCVNPKFKTEEETYILEKLPVGTYSVRVRAVSLAGDGPFSEKTYFVLPVTVDSDKSSSVQQPIIITIISFILIISGVCVLCWKQRHHKLEAEDMCLIASVNPDYVSANYTEDEWELVRDRVTLIRELGQGSFGMVYEGELAPEGSGTSIPCAIKTMNESANCRERLQFLHEASVMKAFTAHHVVRLLGVVSRGQPTLVVMELMARGDLKTYLRSNRDTGEPSPKRLLHMAAQIADGMLYLSTKKFVHRDLAARNCMVSQDLTVKIGDFGMTRDIYETDYYRKGSKGLLPVRWMAPESLHDGVFTSSSDVWSYGVVLWEMSTHAEQPYQGQSNEQVLQQILAGGSLTPPIDCPEVLSVMMEACWQRSPLARPTFANLLERFLPLVPPEFAQLSFYHSRSSNGSSPTEHTRLPRPTRNGSAPHLPP